MTRGIVENLVIGGGPAGSMVAMRLASAGRPVTLLERESTAHHKVCGEFLSREAVEYLGQIGIDPGALGALPIDRVRLNAGRTTVETALPFLALSLSRSVLDAAMLARASAKGCAVRRGVEVEALTRVGDVWRVDLRGEEPVWARTVFLATGKHDVRGWPRGKGKQTDLIGFKLYWRLAPAQVELLRNAMELFLFPQGYGGMSLVEGESANLCFVVRRGKLRDAGGWRNLMDELRRTNRRLYEHLEGADALFDRPLAIAPIPYGYVAHENRGVWCVGDQAAVIPSFTGDGMSIALHSAALAAQMYCSGGSIDAFQQTLRGQLRAGMRLATLLSRGMVTGVGRQLAPVGLALAPDAMRWIAAWTRIPAGALEASRAWLAKSPVLS